MWRNHHYAALWQAAWHYRQRHYSCCSRHLLLVLLLVLRLVLHLVVLPVAVMLVLLELPIHGLLLPLCAMQLRLGCAVLLPMLPLLPLGLWRLCSPVGPIPLSHPLLPLRYRQFSAAQYKKGATGSIA